MTFHLGQYPPLHTLCKVGSSPDETHLLNLGGGPELRGGDWRERREITSTVKPLT